MSENLSVNSAHKPLERRGWGVISGTVFAAFAFLGPGLLIAPLVPFIIGLGISDDSQQFILEALVDILILIALIVIIKTYGLTFEAIGLSKKIELVYVVLPLIVLPMYYIAAWLTVSLAQLAFPTIDMNAAQPIGFTKTTHGPELALIFIALVLVPPFVEESLFRGFLFRAYRRRFGAVAASLIISLIFALLHTPVGVSIDVFVLSLFLCYLRTKTDNLWPSIIMHGLKNFVAFIFLFIIGVK
jgi:membrane protease YdiL (CAAX protease family)